MIIAAPFFYGLFWGRAISRPDFSSRDGIGTGLSATPYRSVGSGLKPDPTERYGVAPIPRPSAILAARSGLKAYAK